MPLATLELQLICHQRWQGVWDETVLLPNAQVMPLLHQQLETGGSEPEVPPRTWQEPTMWLEQLQQRPVALPVCPALAPDSWWQEQGVVAVADQPTVRERLWLLLPDDIDLPLAARASLRLIRRRLSRAMARRESALLKGIRADGLELVGDGEAA